MINFFFSHPFPYPLHLFAYLCIFIRRRKKSYYILGLVTPRISEHRHPPPPLPPKRESTQRWESTTFFGRTYSYFFDGKTGWPAVCYSGGGNGSKAEVSALPSKYSDVGTRWDSEERARGLHFAFMEFHDARVNQKFRVVRGCGVMEGGDLFENACSTEQALS